MWPESNTSEGYPQRLIRPLTAVMTFANLYLVRCLVRRESQMNTRVLAEKMKVGASELQVIVAGNGLLPTAVNVACCCCSSSCSSSGGGGKGK
jgi:hypothetical protein